MFTAQYIAELKRRHANTPAASRPDVYFVATSRERVATRAWINAAVGRLPEPGRTKMVKRLRSDEFLTASHEMAVAAILQTCDLVPEYEPDLDGGDAGIVTPDLVVREPTRLIVEVWTKEIPQAARSAAVRWALLRDRVAEIERPAALVVEAPRLPELTAPLSQDLPRLAERLRRWLLDPTTQLGDVAVELGYTFRFAQEHGTGPGARLVVPVSAGSVDSALLRSAIRDKTRKYRRVAEAHDAALMVVIAADALTPLSVGDLEAVLAGKQFVSVNFSPHSPGGLIMDHSARMQFAEEPLTFDPALSAVASLDIGADSFGVLNVVPVAGAARPLPRLESGVVEL